MSRARRVVTKLSETQELRSLDRLYPKAGSMVNGFRVGDQVDNTSSISSSLYEYEILEGIREVPMFAPRLRNPSAQVRELAEEIMRNKRIDPLIVVHEMRNPREPYVLEGGHRYSALAYLGVESFPALVVVDTEER